MCLCRKGIPNHLKVWTRKRDKDTQWKRMHPEKNSPCLNPPAVSAAAERCHHVRKRFRTKWSCRWSVSRRRPSHWTAQALKTAFSGGLTQTAARTDETVLRTGTTQTAQVPTKTHQLTLQSRTGSSPVTQTLRCLMTQRPTTAESCMTPKPLITALCLNSICFIYYWAKGHR